MPKTSSEFQKAYKILNRAQKQAVDTIEGPVMILAGPGTGKTQILTLRIANILLKTDTPPDAVLALTFTESAAKNMRERLVSLVGEPAYKIPIFTFHGFAQHIINEFDEEFEQVAQSTLLTDIEQALLIAKLIDELELEKIKPFFNPHMYVKDIISAISNLKREGILPKEVEKFAKEKIKEIENEPSCQKKRGGPGLKSECLNKIKKLEKTLEFAKVYEAYQKALKENMLYDFEDMLIEVVSKMESDPDLKMRIQENYLYVLADEHQDANAVQNKLLELLTDFHDEPNLFVVGDGKQAIYRFQGASLDHFLEFKHKYKNAKLITLEDSYRSAQDILDTAHHLILKDPVYQKEAKLKSNAKDQDANIKIFVLPDDVQEAIFVSKEIEKLIEEGVPKKEIAILTRDNKDTTLFAKALAKKGIPYFIGSDKDIISNPQIEKLVMLLKELAEFGEDAHLSALLHFDFIGAKPLDVYKIIKYSRRTSKSIHEIISSKTLLQNAKVEDPDFFKTLHFKLSKYAKELYNYQIDELIGKIINDFGYLSYVLSLDDAVVVLDKLHSFVELSRYLSRSRDSYTAYEFLSDLDLIKKHKLNIKKSASVVHDGVQIMTAHASKGLEFEYVFLTNAYNGKWGNKKDMSKFILPISKLDKEEQNKDERRLFYVAMTRAKKGLFVTYGKYSDSGSVREESIFVADLKEKVPAEEIELDKKELAQYLVFEKEKKPINDIEYLRGLFIEQGLSPTALNNFLKCPWTFFYRNLIRIPEPKELHLIYGQAMHFLLEKAYKKALKGGKLTEKEAEKYATQIIKKQAISKKAFDEALKKTLKMFNLYIKHNPIDISSAQKAELEKRVEAHLELEGLDIPFVRITGQLDKVEYTKDGQIIVTDYKTGSIKSKNEILGQTANSTGDIYRQLVFYKLLLSKEGKNVDKVVVEFLEPRDPEAETPKYQSHEFIVPDEDVEELKAQIREATKEIYNFDFWDRRCKDYEKGHCKYCELRDQMKSN